MKRLNLTKWKPKKGFWKSLESSLRDMNTRGINVVFVSEEYMRYLKKNFFGRDEGSDVLTFVYDDVKEVVVCPEYLKNDEIEVARRIIHGILHALGYDHKFENRAESMEKLERKILSTFLSLYYVKK